MYDRKKQRGQKRKLNKMFRYIEQFTPFFDTQKEYEHFNVPSDIFIEHNKTSIKIKNKFCKKWLETTEKFILQKPEKLPFCKIVAVISVPNLWSSQIIIFYDKDYYNTFWERNSYEQIWHKISDNQSFCKKHNIITNLPEIGYHEIIKGDDYYFEDKLWFYGEIPNPRFLNE